MTTRWAIFISGYGANLQAVTDWLGEIEIAAVVTNKAACEGVKKAKRSGIPVWCLPVFDWVALSSQLRLAKVDRIFLLGFMRIVPQSFLDSWKGQVFNLHPSLLPNYKGLNAFERAVADAFPLGASVHHVVAGVDEGEVIAQRQYLDSRGSIGYRDTGYPQEVPTLRSQCEQGLVKSLMTRQFQKFPLRRAG